MCACGVCHMCAFGGSSGSCMTLSTGSRLLGEHLGAHSGVGDGVGYVEGGHLCRARDRRDGDAGSEHAEESSQAGQGSQGMYVYIYPSLASSLSVSSFPYVTLSLPPCSPLHPTSSLSLSLPLPLPQDKTNWTITGSLRGRIETFKKTMPLIQDLKNPAMRLRHWTQLQEEIQKPFDHTSTCKARHAVYSTCTTQHAVDMLYTVHVQRNML